MYISVASLTAERHVFMSASVENEANIRQLWSHCQRELSDEVRHEVHENRVLVVKRVGILN